MKKRLSGVTCWFPTNPQNSRPILKSLDDSACQLKPTFRKYRSRKREAFSKCATEVITQQEKCCKPEQSIFTLKAHLVCQHITISMGLATFEKFTVTWNLHIIRYQQAAAQIFIFFSLFPLKEHQRASYSLPPCLRRTPRVLKSLFKGCRSLKQKFRSLPRWQHNYILIGHLAITLHVRN